MLITGTEQIRFRLWWDGGGFSCGISVHIVYIRDVTKMGYAILINVIYG